MTYLDDGLDSLIYFLDEPTVGLSFFDVGKLMELLDRNIFSKLAESKKRKCMPIHFSYNSNKRRYPLCKGTGEQI